MDNINVKVNKYLRLVFIKMKNKDVCRAVIYVKIHQHAMYAIILIFLQINKPANVEYIFIIFIIAIYLLYLFII
jgi:hypothetical protein